VVRLSRHSKRPDDPSTSPDRQREHIRRAAEARGLEIVGWAEDLDVSANKIKPWDRPELGQWLPDLDRPDHGAPLDFDVLIFWKLDRIIRSSADFQRLIEWARDSGTNLVSVTENLDLATAMGRFVTTIIAALAEMEAELVRERTLDSRAALRALRRYAGGSYPFWLTPVDNPEGSGFVLAHNPDGVRVVRELCERVIAGESQSAVVDDFNRRGVPTPGELSTCRTKVATRWQQSSTVKILRGRALLGETTVNGDVQRDQDGLPLLFAPPVLDNLEWAQLQAALDAVKPVDKRPRDRDAQLLTKLAFCAACGAPRHYRTTRTPRSKRAHADHKARGGPCPADCKVEFRYLGCANQWHRKRGDPEFCQAGALPADDVHEHVGRAFLDMVGDAPETRRVVHPAQDHAAELARVTEARDYFLGEVVRLGPAAAVGYQHQLDALNAQIEALARQEPKPARSELVTTGRTFREVWATSTGAGRRRLLRDGGFRVLVAPYAGMPVNPLLLGTVHGPAKAEPQTLYELSWVTDAPFSLVVLVPTDLAERINAHTAVNRP
jgi:DNA invertase Pin-like site-specific DNA recombinase